MNADQTVIALRQLAAAFPREITRDVIELWHNVFDDTPDERVQAAVAEWIKTAEHFPSPAQLRSVMRSQLRRQQMEAPPALPEPTDPEPDDTGRPRDRRRILPPSEGIDIAYASYVRECERRGIPPRTRQSFAERLPIDVRRERQLSKRWRREMGHDVEADEAVEAYTNGALDDAAAAEPDEPGEWADPVVEPDPEGPPSPDPTEWPDGAERPHPAEGDRP